MTRTGARLASRIVVTGAAATFVIGLAVLLASSVALGSYATAVSGTPRPVFGTIVLLAAVAGSALGAAWWTARAVVPRFAAPAYKKAGPSRCRAVTMVASVIAGTFFGVITWGEGPLAASTWFAMVAGAGAIGAGAATRSRAQEQRAGNHGRPPSPARGRAG